MLPSRRHLHALSRDPATLRRAVLLTATVFLLSAVWIHFVRPVKPDDLPHPTNPQVHALRSILQTENPDRGALVRHLRDHAEREAVRQQSRKEEDPDDWEIAMAPEPGLTPLLAASKLPAGEPQAFLDWHDALLAGKVPDGVLPRIAALTFPNDPGLPRLMAADLKRTARDYEGALADYETAGAEPALADARRRAVALAVSRDWTGVIDRLLAQPAYYEAVHEIRDDLSRLVAQEQFDVPQLFRRNFEGALGLLAKTDYLLLSLLTAAVWFVSLHKACRLPRRQWWFSLAGLPLGIFSTIVALVLLSLQQARHGLTDSEAAGPALLFQIASVGLREESAKLLCFLPLALLLLRHGTPARALMAASCTGLGFALKENIGYYQLSGGAGVLSRFVTATFLHIALTGLSGLAFFKFLRYPKNFGPLFLATFTGMVMLHGFYNFSQAGFDNPFSRELSGLFPFIIAGLAWYYFQTVRQEQDDAPQRLSAEAVFLLGTTMVTGTLLNYLVWENGWETGLGVLVPTALSSVLFCWLFHHLLRNA